MYHWNDVETDIFQSSFQRWLNLSTGIVTAPSFLSSPLTFLRPCNEVCRVSETYGFAKDTQEELSVRMRMTAATRQSTVAGGFKVKTTAFLFDLHFTSNSINCKSANFNCK